MKASKFSEAQIAFVLKQAEDGTAIGEVMATTLLLFVILSLLRTDRANLIALAVPGVIGAAYFFTSSTSLANPAVSIARSLSNSFAGIDPNSVPAFIAMQIIGAFLGYSIIRWIFVQESKS